MLRRRLTCSLLVISLGAAGPRGRAQTPAVGGETPIAPAASDGQSPASQPAATSAPIAADASGAAAPADPPATVAERVFHFDELAFDLSAEAEWQRRQTITEAGRPDFRRRIQIDRYRRVEETGGLRGEGNLFDERVLKFSFDGRYGLEQQDHVEAGYLRDRSASPDGDLLEGDARVSLFPAGRITANAFASKRDDRVPRPFLPSLDRQRERYGAEVLYNDRVLPMRLSFEDLYEELLAPGRSLDDERRTDRTLKYEATWQPSERHQLRLEYEYNDRGEQYSGERTRFDTTRNYLTLNHVVQFGADGRSRLETIARFQDESGDLSRDTYELAPRVRWQVTDTLAARAGAQFLKEKFEQQTIEVFRGDAGLTHVLGDALTSSVDAYGLRQQAEQGGDVSEWGGSAAWSLAKETGIGRFAANLTYNHVQSRDDGGDQDGLVLDESQTFRDPLPIYLNHRDVRPLSVIVRDSTRRRLYLPGRDYLILHTGRYTFIQRVLTGAIVDGQTVLVTYQYRTSQGLELSRDRVDLRIQHTFAGKITPYYAASFQDEDIDRQRFLPYDPRRVVRHRVGVEFRVRRISASAEYEYNNDSIDPYQAGHLNGDVALLEAADQSLSARGRASYFRYEGREDLAARDATLTDAGLNYRYLFSRSVEGNAAAAYRFENDSLFGRTHGVDLSASLNWKIGLFTALFEVEYDLLDLSQSSDGTFTAWIKLRRDFPIIARGQP